MPGIKPNNVIRIPTGRNIEKLLRFWLEFLHPFHRLTNREMDVATAFLKKRYELYKDIPTNAELRDKILMNEETQKEIREKCGLKVQHLQVIKNKLKKNKFFIDNKINPRLIPNIKETENSFQLLLLFELDSQYDAVQ